MSLESGRYLIKNQNKYIGRHLHESMSMLPKHIVTLPEDVQAPKVWQVEPTGDNTYILRCKDGIAREHSDEIYAVVLHEPHPQEWYLEHVPHHGENVYVILRKDRQQGWIVTSDEDYQHVKCRPLLVGPSLPPFYPPNERFEFIRASESD
ncbi:hypothetical protein VNI00_014984 [Paramarasmius palmivorus]|uniref:Uncharacterized protein n=1 Tax=Paramarasmius palmivorus TaxID=297713 RepID=A0AAW0BN78_9AGAR